MTPEQVALYAAIAVAVGSEVLAWVPGLRANSWTQLILTARAAFAEN